MFLQESKLFLYRWAISSSIRLLRLCDDDVWREQCLWNLVLMKNMYELKWIIFFTAIMRLLAVLIYTTMFYDLHQAFRLNLNTDCTEMLPIVRNGEHILYNYFL